MNILTILQRAALGLAQHDSADRLLKNGRQVIGKQLAPSSGKREVTLTDQRIQFHVLTGAGQNADLAGVSALIPTVPARQFGSRGLSSHATLGSGCFGVIDRARPPPARPFGRGFMCTAFRH
jgi:hypothetical protein